MEAWEKLEAVYEKTFSVMVELSNLATSSNSRQGDRKNRNKTTQETEKLDQEFTGAQNRALVEYLDNKRDDRSSVSTENPESVHFTGTGKPSHVVRQEKFQTSTMTCFLKGNIVGKIPQKITLNILDQNRKVLMNLILERRLPSESNMVKVREFECLWSILGTPV